MLILHIQHHIDSNDHEVFDLDNPKDFKLLTEEFDAIAMIFKKYPRKEAIKHTLSYLSKGWNHAWIDSESTKVL